MSLVRGRFAALLVFVMLAAMSISLLPHGAAAASYTGTTGMESMETQVVNLINNHRKANGLPALKVNSKLNGATWLFQPHQQGWALALDPHPCRRLYLRDDG